MEKQRLKDDCNTGRIIVNLHGVDYHQQKISKNAPTHWYVFIVLQALLG